MVSWTMRLPPQRSAELWVVAKGEVVVVGVQTPALDDHVDAHALALAAAPRHRLAPVPGRAPNRVAGAVGGPHWTLQWEQPYCLPILGLWVRWEVCDAGALLLPGRYVEHAHSKQTLASSPILTETPPIYEMKLWGGKLTPLIWQASAGRTEWLCHPWHYCGRLDVLQVTGA